MAEERSAELTRPAPATSSTPLVRKLTIAAVDRPRSPSAADQHSMPKSSPEYPQSSSDAGNARHPTTPAELADGSVSARDSADI